MSYIVEGGPDGPIEFDSLVEAKRYAVYLLQEEARAELLPMMDARELDTERGREVERFYRRMKAHEKALPKRRLSLDEDVSSGARRAPKGAPRQNVLKRQRRDAIRLLGREPRDRYGR